MKSTLNPVEKTGDTKVLPEVQQTGPVKRHLTFVVVGLILILLIGLVVLAAMIYNNTKINKKSLEAVSDTDALISAIEKKIQNSEDQVTENPKMKTKNTDKVEANITYHIGKSGKEIKENIAVSGKEEIITTKDAKFIYDYGSNLMTTKLFGSDNNTCYVTRFNNSGSIEGVKAALRKPRSDAYVANISDVKYVASGVVVNRTSLSTNAKALCDDSKLIWLNRTAELQDGDEQIRKRQVCRWVERQYCVDEVRSRTEKKCGGWWRRRCRYRTYYYRYRRCYTYRVRVCR